MEENKSKVGIRVLACDVEWSQVPRPTLLTFKSVGEPDYIEWNYVAGCDMGIMRCRLRIMENAGKGGNLPDVSL